MDLIQAADNDDIIRVRELLNQGADPNIRDIDGDTALIKATSWNHIEIVELLLDNETDPNIPDRFGSTALMIASYRGLTEMVRLLLNRGADPNIQSEEDNTALIMASFNLIKGTDYTKIVELLLDHGADPNIRGPRGLTALMWAKRKRNNEVARLIRDHIRLQKARQRLAFATRLLGDNTRMDDLDYDVTTRIAEYLHDLDQYGSGKRSSSRSRSERSRRSRRSRRKRIKNKYYTRRRSFF